MKVYLSAEFRALGVPFAAPRTGDAGYDLYALETVTLLPGENAVISTGVHVEIPLGYVGIIKDRSSMALRGIHTYGGVIDASYRGEIRIILNNISPSEQLINKGQKFAQMVVIPCYVEGVEVVESLDYLSSTQRGASGFGSTGQ
jgi:dUTP pyrophosphatase